MAARSFASILACPQHVRFGVIWEVPVVRYCRLKGRVNRKDLEGKFDISTQQASNDLGKYQEAAPGNIEYNPTEKAYLRTADFNPKFLILSPERYLLQLHALTTGAIRQNDTWFDKLPPIAVATDGRPRSGGIRFGKNSARKSGAHPARKIRVLPELLIEYFG
jgi:hypothetical protein